jgi:hypothetical protein
MMIDFIWLESYRKEFRAGKARLSHSQTRVLPNADPGTTLQYMPKRGMPKRAALGFKLHTGWAALVAITGKPGKLEVLLRRRIELLPGDESIPRFIYHKASELPLRQAAGLVQRGKDAAEIAARAAVKDAIKHLKSFGFTVEAAGIPSSSRQLPGELAAILNAHPVIHTAEGILFQQAAASACKSNKLVVVSARERDVWAETATAWAVSEASLREEIDGLRESIGAPWGADQKTAAAFALRALVSSK